MKSNPDLWEPHLPKLLEIAGASKDAKTHLVDHLELAQYEIWMAQIDRERPPPRLVKQLRDHLGKTIELLEKLNQYPGWHETSVYLSWAPPPAPYDGAYWHNSPLETLRGWESRLDNPRMGAPAREDRDIAVSRAAQFFEEHSPHGLSGDTFVKFSELFFCAATGTAVDGTMDYAVRKAREAKQRSI